MVIVCIYYVRLIHLHPSEKLQNRRIKVEKKKGKRESIAPLTMTKLVTERENKLKQDQYRSSFSPSKTKWVWPERWAWYFRPWWRGSWAGDRPRRFRAFSRRRRPPTEWNGLASGANIWGGLMRSWWVLTSELSHRIGMGLENSVSKRCCWWWSLCSQASSLSLSLWIYVSLFSLSLSPSFFSLCIYVSLFRGVCMDGSEMKWGWWSINL